MTPEKEIELCETVATISADLKNCIANQTLMATALAVHTQADSANFEKIDAKLDQLVGEDNKRIGAAKNKASIWTGVSVIAGVGGWELVKRLIGLH
jgi:hypothetical protein